MLNTCRRIAKAMARALVDLLSLAMLLPTLAISFTMYKLTLLVMLYLLKDISYQHISAVVDVIKQTVAQLRAEGWDGLKVRLLAVLDVIKTTAVQLTTDFSAWVKRQIAQVTDDLGSDAPIAGIVLNT